MDAEIFIIMDLCLFWIVGVRTFLIVRIEKEIAAYIYFAESEKNLNNMRRTIQKVMTTFDDEFAIWWSKGMLEKLPKMFASDSWKIEIKEEIERRRHEIL